MSDSLGSWIDGVAADLLPADDRGLQYGDGLFETILVRDGRPRFLEAHLARLTRGCQRLMIPFDRLSELRAEIASACRQAPVLAILKIVVTRGSATRRGYAPDGAVTPRRILSLWKTAALAAEYRDGVSLVLSSVSASEQPLLAGIKHLNRLENVLAAAEARAAQVFDALMRTQNAHLVSGTISAGDAPALDFHCTTDPLVNYQWAVDTVNQAKAAGLVAFLESWDETCHVPYQEHRQQILDQERNFFWWAMDLTHAAT